MTYKAYAKVNIFLKITGVRENYHEIASRFMRVDSLYDELRFFKKSSTDFEIKGAISCSVEHNTIYKVFLKLKELCNNPVLENFFKENGVEVEKRVPEFAGLGGGSSDAATFLHMCNDMLELGLETKTLAAVGAKVGADIPFFVYNYASANVSGIGEIVEPYKEELLHFDLFTPEIKISTPLVYQTYRKHFFNPIDDDTKKILFQSTSRNILQHATIDEANDLYHAACHAYPTLQSHYKQGYFFSGSGSSFFKPL